MRLGASARRALKTVETVRVFVLNSGANVQSKAVAVQRSELQRGRCRLEETRPDTTRVLWDPHHRPGTGGWDGTGRSLFL